MVGEIDSMRLLNQRFTKEGYQVKIKSDVETIVPSTFFNAVVTWGPMGFRFVLKLRDWIIGVSFLLGFLFFLLEVISSLRYFPFLLIIGIILAVILIVIAFLSKGKFQKILKITIEDVEKNFMGMPNQPQIYSHVPSPNATFYNTVIKNNCPRCGKKVSTEFMVCPYCGQPLSVQIICKKCGKNLEMEFNICPYCGTPK